MRFSIKAANIGRELEEIEVTPISIPAEVPVVPPSEPAPADVPEVPEPAKEPVPV